MLFRSKLKPKYEYFAGEMGRKLEELKEFPQYFAFSLENRIKPRHMKVVQSGIALALPVMLKSTDEEFRELVKQGGGSHKPLIEDSPSEYGGGIATMRYELISK